MPVKGDSVVLSALRRGSNVLTFASRSRCPLGRHTQIGRRDGRPRAAIENFRSLYSSANYHFMSCPALCLRPTAIAARPVRGVELLRYDPLQQKLTHKWAF